jgi:threonine-phosphate decarboxylase
MNEYKHGGDVYTALLESGKTREEILDFSANINPLGTPKGVQEAIQKAALNLGDYPDPHCRDLKEAIAKKEGINAKHIACGNGAADLIFRMVHGLKPTKALLFSPTFSEYEKALTERGCELVVYPLKEEEGYQLQWAQLECFLETHQGIDMIFICNPNNPTGIILSQEILLKIVTYCNEKNIVVVVDECFVDFVDQPQSVTMKAYLKGYPNLILLKAFTKLYALAGARLGYILSHNQDLLAQISKTGQAWSVSTLAQAAGVAALQEEAYVNQTKVFLQKERTYLKKELRALGFKVYDSHANYIFFQVMPEKEEPLSLEKWLYKKGILIRNCANYKGLTQGYYRIAVRTKIENETLIKQIKEWEQWQRV